MSTIHYAITGAVLTICGAELATVTVSPRPKDANCPGCRTILDAQAAGTVARSMRRRELVQAEGAVANDILRRGYPPPCEHRQFESSVDVYRPTATEGGEVTGYQADIRIRCADCRLPFQFIGLPGGVSQQWPARSLAADAAPRADPADGPGHRRQTRLMRRPIVAGALVDGVWCPNCNADTRLRIPLHYGGRHTNPVAHVEVCVSCGHHYMPSVPVVTVTQLPRTLPHPVRAVLWWLHRRNSLRARPASCRLRLARLPPPGLVGMLLDRSRRRRHRPACLLRRPAPSPVAR